MIKRILVALDETERAHRVATVAGELARGLGAELIPFHALPFPQDFPAAGATKHPDQLPALLVAEARARLTMLAKDFQGATSREPVIRVGEAAHAILAAAEELDVDLIAMGSHGFHGWDRILGTTVSMVSNRAKRHVFVVHDPANRQASAPPTGFEPVP